MNQTTIVYKRLSEIKPYENNPRRNDDAVHDVKLSIQKYGFKQPIVVDRDGVIVVGHTRYAAACELGLKEVPVIVSELTEKQNREYRIADNKTNEAAGWDFIKLDMEIGDLDFSEFDFKLSPENDIDIDGLFAEAEQKEPKEKEPKRIQCPHCGEWFVQED